jgi:hypothetical protein
VNLLQVPKLRRCECKSVLGVHQKFSKEAGVEGNFSYQISGEIALPGCRRDPKSQGSLEED